MPEPTRISPNTGAVYSADLLYEQNCKCGTTEVYTDGETFDFDVLGDYGWKMVCMEAGNLESLECTNISATDCSKLAAIAYVAGQEIVAAIESFSIDSGAWIVYKDCNLS